MFQKARLKLTIWYVAIILLITGTLSIIAYYRVTSVLDDRFAHMQVKIDRNIRREFPNIVRIPADAHNLSSDLQAAKNQIALQLIIINAGIAVITAGASFFLSGKTLLPIQKTLDEHKRFISDAAHELRTPITSLKTSIEVSLMDKSLQKETQELLQDNLGEISHLENLTGSLLQLARQDHADEEPCFEPVVLQEVVNQVVRQMMPLARKKKINLECIAPRKPVQINGQKERIREMIRIFLDNAVKYTPTKGKIELHIKKEKARAILEIQDTGIGIERQHLLHIFDRFYRVDSARSKNGEGGYGLGLSIAKKIIKQHNGRVDVESTPGKGTTFSVSFFTS